MIHYNWFEWWTQSYVAEYLPICTYIAFWCIVYIVISVPHLPAPSTDWLQYMPFPSPVPSLSIHPHNSCSFYPVTQQLLSLPVAGLHANEVVERSWGDPWFVCLCLCWEAEGVAQTQWPFLLLHKGTGLSVLHTYRRPLNVRTSQRMLTGPL